MSAAYEAWGAQDGKPVLLGVRATKGDCDRIHRHTEGPGITVSGGVVVAVKTGTGPAAKASLQHTALAAFRERGNLEAPAERAPLALVRTPEPAPARDELEDDEDEEEVRGEENEDEDDTNDTSEDTVDRSASTSTPAAPETTPSAPTGACPCGEPSAAARRKTTPELRDLCKVHRKRARDLAAKIPGYTPALARERVVTGQRPAALGAAPTASERGARGGKARTKILRPAVAETVRRAPKAPKPTRAAKPKGQLAARVAIVRRLIDVEGQLGGIDAVEQLAALAVEAGGVEALAGLLEAVRG